MYATCCCWDEVRFGYCNQVMCCFVENDEACFCPTLGKRFPFECLEHVCDIACVMVSICSKYCCPSFHFVKRVSSFCGMWIPNGAAVFQLWSDKGFIGKVFGFTWGCVKVSFDET